MSAELFIELRCEELPARMVRPALQGLADAAVALIEGVPHGAVRTWATPRRLAVAIADVHAGRPKTEREVLGPPADKAFRDGVPTPVGEGFARGKGADPAGLYVVDLPKRGAVAAVKVSEGGETVVELVSQGMAALITGLPFAKSMTWGHGTLAFGRPLHGIVVTYAGSAVEGEAHGIPFTSMTLGHRLAEGVVEVSGSESWLAGLRTRWVEPDLEVRKARIQHLLDDTAASLGADRVVDPALLEEVTQLVEWPTAVVGVFDPELLSLPSKLLVTSMKVNQRYFAVHQGGVLTNRFVVIANNPGADPEVVAEGNARVLRARFHDARFFLHEDQQIRLELHGGKLAAMRWIRGLGTMSDKQVRLGVLGAALATWTGANADAVERAAELCKCDLTTLMVGEFPDLQGHMGGLYAKAQGESAAVASAIEEHWQPKGADDAVAASPEGAALALAERLDTLVGCFGIGLEPTGGGDPQGLRRAAVGVLRTVFGHGLRGTLRPWISQAVQVFHAAALEGAYEGWLKARGEGEAPRDAEGLVQTLLTFVMARFEALSVGEGASPDLVASVVATVDPATLDLMILRAKLQAVLQASGSSEFSLVLQTFKRVLNILGDERLAMPTLDRCTTPSEAALWVALERVDAEVQGASEVLDFGGALAAALSLRGPVEDFFEAVMVNDDDPEVRATRRGLLSGVASVFLRIADFSKISTRQGATP